MTTPFGPDDLEVLVDDDFDGPTPGCDCEDCEDEREFAGITAQLTAEGVSR